jgi:hypothetical protein
VHRFSGTTWNSRYNDEADTYWVGPLMYMVENWENEGTITRYFTLKIATHFRIV